MSEHDEYQRTYFGSRRLPRMGIELSSTPYVQRQVAEVVDSLGLPPGSQVIDVGCGLGKYTAVLADRGFRTSGLDLTPELIERLSLDRPDIEAHVGSAADPPPGLRGRFDGATGFFFLHHVDDLVGIFTGVRELLVPGGVAVFLEPNPAYLPFYLQITLTPGMTWKGERGMVDLTVAKTTAAAAAAGFDTCEIRAFGAMPPAIANRAWGRSLERGLEALPGWSRIGAFRMTRLS